MEKIRLSRFRLLFSIFIFILVFIGLLSFGAMFQSQTTTSSAYLLEINNLNQKISTIENDISISEAELSSANDALSISKDEIASLQRELTVARDEIVALQGELTTSKDEVTSLQTELVTSMDKITVLQDQLDSTNHELETALDDLATTKETLANLEDEISAQNEEEEFASLAEKLVGTEWVAVQRPDDLLVTRTTMYFRENGRFYSSNNIDSREGTYYVIDNEYVSVTIEGRGEDIVRITIVGDEMTLESEDGSTVLEFTKVR